MAVKEPTAKDKETKRAWKTRWAKMTILVDFKKSKWFRIHRCKKRTTGKYAIENTAAIEIELGFCLVLIYFGHLIHDCAEMKKQLEKQLAGR